MRIALVQDYLRLGGTESQAVALANAFAAAGHEVLLLTFRPGGAVDTRVVCNIRRVALQRRDWRLDWFAPGLVTTLREFRPDVIQLMGRMANAHGWRVIRALPHVCVVATFRTGKPIPGFFVATLRRAHAIVGNSREAAGRLESRYAIPRERVTVIANAMLAAPEPPADGTREIVRSEIGTPSDTLVLLCVAMMRRGKGHRDLVEMFASLDPRICCELWLAGDGTELRDCEARARALRVADRVRFLGRRTDTNRLYAAADLAMLASRTESLPNFLVEAQWSGLPVVAWDTAGVGETFRPDHTGVLVPLGDREGFVAAVEQLAGDPTLRARMAAEAPAFARREFDPAQQNRRYLDLYAAITKSRPSM